MCRQSLWHNRRNRSQATDGEGIKLVNLATDIREEHDLTAKYPEKAKELKALWEKWNAAMAKPGGDNSSPRRAKTK